MGTLAMLEDQWEWMDNHDREQFVFNLIHMMPESFIKKGTNYWRK